MVRKPNKTMIGLFLLLGSAVLFLFWAFMSNAFSFLTTAMSWLCIFRNPSKG